MRERERRRKDECCSEGIDWESKQSVTRRALSRLSRLVDLECAARQGERTEGRRQSSLTDCLGSEQEKERSKRTKLASERETNEGEVRRPNLTSDLLLLLSPFLSFSLTPTSLKFAHSLKNPEKNAKRKRNQKITAKGCPQT